MTEPSPGYQRFFAELKRRKVFRVAAVYGVTAFVVLQAADLLAAGLDLPGWVFRAITLLALVGFPIALVLAWAFEATPEGVRRTESAATEEIERIVAQPALKRWPSGLLALVGVALLVAGAWWVGRRSASPGGNGATAADSAMAEGAGARPLEASIAVLPFADMSPDGDQEHFSDGISEELLNLLARVRDLRVAARTSSFAFEGDDLPIPVIADSLNVAHVLEGSVRKAGEEVRITAQLIRAEDGYHVWSESWDRTLEDVFAVQDEIASEVVDRLRVTLLGAAPTVEETDPEAYALVLRARHLSEQRSEEDLIRAEELYRRALAMDSTYAAGWTGLASNYIRMSNFAGFSDSFARAREAARRALALDPENPRAHAALGHLAQAEGDLSAAAGHYERALTLAPGDAWILARASTVLMTLGRLEEAIRVLEYQIARDPVSVAGYLNLGLARFGAGRWDDAAGSVRTVIELNPETPAAHALFGLILIRAGEPEAGLAAIRQEPSEFWQLVGEVVAYHALGRSTDSDAALAELVDGYARRGALNIAYVLAYRGEIDRAFEWLDRAVEYEDPGLSEIFVLPAFEVLHDDPRWPAFLERLGKSPEDLEAVEFEVDLPGAEAPEASSSTASSGARADSTMPRGRRRP